MGKKHIRRVFDNATFIKRAREIHKDRYDYSFVEYSGSGKKVNIRCKEHDYIFSQTPSAHLIGQGCPKCGKVDSTQLNQPIITILD